MKKDSQTENCTIVNGVVLTHRAIAFLNSLQESDNAYLKEALGEINNTISLLINDLEGYTAEEKHEALESIKYLNSFARNFKELMKP